MRGPDVRLEEARVDALGLGRNKANHRLDQLGRCEHLALVGHSLLRLTNDGCAEPSNAPLLN